MNNLQKYINKYSDDIIITGGVTEERISKVENELDIELTNEYKDYLRNYGIIMGYGVEFLGCGKSNDSSLVRETLRYRKLGLEKECIVIRNVDEWVYCLNVCTSEISSWDRIEKTHKLISNNLEEYILSTLREAQEDW